MSIEIKAFAIYTIFSSIVLFTLVAILLISLKKQAESKINEFTKQARIPGKLSKLISIKLKSK